MRSGRRKSDAFTFLATPPIKTRAMEFAESEEYGTEKIIDMWKGGAFEVKRYSSCANAVQGDTKHANL